MIEVARRARNEMAGLLIVVIRVVVLAYLGICLLVYLRQASYIYYPDRHIDMTPAALGLAFEELRLTTSDGETIAAWYVPAGPDPTQGWSMVFCHGNAGDIGDRVGSIRSFHDLGIHVLIFDYRGYGDSTGKPTEQGTYRDAEAAWRHLTDVKGVPPAQIIAFGRSLGGAVASWLALEHPPGLLVLESAFTSATDMGARLFPYLPIRALSRFKYDTLARLPDIRCTLLVAHGRADGVIPYAHGERLFAAASEPKRFIEIAGGHNDGGMDADPHYREQFRVYLESLTEED